ncbi:unnamed protein product [Arctia plantaginis]|uniref:Peptidase S1 domain-containing protein n=1 Tax=Arctia plantaginis TaxID=874455 RepID=A0A8S1BUY7_ARCPL|nr:unnamed protein product [Arctia plantaginis]
MLPQDSPCAWNGSAGRCVSVHRCFSAIKDIANKTFPPLCSFEGKTPIICCTDCTLVEDTRLIVINPLLGILYKTGTSKAKDKCIDYIHTLDYQCKNGLFPIIKKKKHDPSENCTYEGTDNQLGNSFASGGRNAEREEFPHMALLGFGDTVDTANWLCGGTVISERFILTAAHCISSLRVGSVKFIALGILKRSDAPSLWQTYNVQRTIPHPEYQPPSKYHDIALLETDRIISFSSKVLPACLHDDNYDLDLYADATGWGALGYKKNIADVLQSVSLRRFTEEDCSERYPKHRHLINGFDVLTQMCYGDTGDQQVPTDTCEGDSGGPLQSQAHDRCVFTILGVTSYGRPCGDAGGAGIYTRVKYYVPWIEDIVWP